MLPPRIKMTGQGGSSILSCFNTSKVQADGPLANILKCKSKISLSLNCLSQQQVSPLRVISLKTFQDKLVVDG